MKEKAKSDPTEEFKLGRNSVNLKFLADFMQRMSISILDIAKLMDISRQGVYYWFVHDDASVSKMQELFDALGYDLVFSLSKSGIEYNKVNVQMKLALEQEPVFGPRLDFLNKAIKTYRIKKTDVSKQMKISSTTIYYWQSHDDCLLSNLYEFAKVTGLNLSISINPKGGQVEDLVEFEDTASEPGEVSTEDDPRYDEIKSTFSMITIAYKSFIEDAEKLVAGNESLGLRVRRASLQVSDLLKDFKNQSKEVDQFE